MPLVSNALLGLHGFTGCESAFHGKGKVKPLKLTKTFAAIAEEPGILDEDFKVIEKIVCELYGHKKGNVNYVCYKLYSSTYMASYRKKKFCYVLTV